MLFIRFICLLLLLAIPAQGSDNVDFYTSVSGLEKLLELENHLLHNLKDYVNRELVKHQQINSLLKDLEKENAKALKNSKEYFNRPINQFKAIKCSLVDFQDLQNYILDSSNEAEYGFNGTRIENGLGLSVATLDDLTGAAVGMERLQKTYKLNSSDLAKGNIWGVQYDTAMSASDSYYMGVMLSGTNYETELEWLAVAWDTLANQSAKEWDFVSKITLLEDYSAIAYHAEKFELARDLSKQLVVMDPNNEDAKANLKTIELNLFHKRNSPKRRQWTEDVKINVSDTYEATCRGDLHQSPSDERPLRCMYVDNNVPFLKIAPFKMEQLSLDPLIVYYHEAIYESEIKQVLETAVPQIVRSTVGTTRVRQVTSHRTSKNSWMELDEYKFLSNVKQRLIDITQLSLETADELQVANYGIGGHYGPHTDFSLVPTITFGEWAGNRIATALFYISDVELGGATAFPHLKLAVKPIRRSLVFWYNLHTSTEPDMRMMHAGCPVLKGSKWILNEWIHERGQEFLRPCGLQPYNSTKIEEIDT